MDDSELDDILAREATKRSTGKPEPVGALLQQVGGSHYTTMAIQPLAFSMANRLNACQHTAIKYIVRRKGDRAARVQDIEKAIHTLQIYKGMIERGLAD